MRAKIVLILTTILLLTTIPAIADQCIAFINYSTTAIRVDPIPRPDFETIIPAKANQILAGDARGSCPKGNCKYGVFEMNTGAFTIIRNVPLGSAIIYGGMDLYYIDKNANVLC